MQPEFETDDPQSALALSRADADHLKLLAIFHYIYAGLVGLSGCCLGLYMIPGVLVATAAADPNLPNPPPQELGFFMMGVAALGMFIVWGTAALVAFAGRNLQQRRGHLYCMIVAGVLCLAIPIGTILGVFTLVVLIRPTVKREFGVA